jgi:hypothetical protein
MLFPGDEENTASGLLLTKLGIYPTISLWNILQYTGDPGLTRSEEGDPNWSLGAGLPSKISLETTLDTGDL